MLLISDYSILDISHVVFNIPFFMQNFILSFAFIVERMKINARKHVHVVDSSASSVNHGGLQWWVALVLIDFDIIFL